MKLSWKLCAAFYFLLHFAVGSFYTADRALGDEVDCRNLCVVMNCADGDSLLAHDFFAFAGIGLVILSVLLPSIMLYRRQKVIQTSILG